MPRSARRIQTCLSSGLPVAQGSASQYYAALPQMLLLILLASITACGESPEPEQAYEHVYTVRGRVVSLPEPSGAGAFMVHHEAIPEYVSINGERGMNQMVMEFAVPDRSVLEGVAKDDIVKITYGESFRPRVRQGVITIEVLPPGTELNLDAP